MEEGKGGWKRGRRVEEGKGGRWEGQMTPKHIHLDCATHPVITRDKVSAKNWGLSKLCRETQ